MTTTSETINNPKAYLDAAGVTSVAGKTLRMVKAETARRAAVAVQNGATPDNDGALSIGDLIDYADARTSSIVRDNDANDANGASLDGTGDLGRILAELVKPYVKGKVNRAEVREIAEEVASVAMFHAIETDSFAAAMHARIAAELDKRPPVKVEVHGVVSDLPKVRHERFERVLWLAANGFNVYLVGPAGTGKTTLAKDLAATLNREHVAISCSAGLSETALLGRMLPTGDGGRWEYQLSAFVERYRDGGVILLDEVDAADPNLLVVINAALANGELYVPGLGTVTRHPDTVIVCAANTYGTGADAMYVGRETLDAATLDRFVGAMVEMDYSDTIEAMRAGQKAPKVKAVKRSPVLDSAEAGAAALSWTRSIRAAVRKAGLRRVVSTRAVNAYMVHAMDGRVPEFLTSFFTGWTTDEQKRIGGDV